MNTNQSQSLLRRINRISAICAVTLIIIFFLLTILEMYDVKIELGGSHRVKIVWFVSIIGIFMISNELHTYTQTVEVFFQMRRFVCNLAYKWGVNVFIFCCVHNYIFGSSFSQILPWALSIAFTIGGAQYVSYVLYRAYYERKINAEINLKLRQQQANDASVRDDIAASEPALCILHSDYGDKDLELQPQDFVYAESVGNYVNVCYLDNEEICSKNLRTTLLNLKNDLSSCNAIVQCHRGFLVNLRYAQTLEGSNNSYYLVLQPADKKVPVSRAYKFKIKAALSAFH